MITPVHRSRGIEDPVTMANTVIRFATKHNYTITVEQMFTYTDTLLKSWGGTSFHGYNSDEDAMRRVRQKFTYLPEPQHSQTSITKLIPIAGGSSYYYENLKMRDMIVGLIELDRFVERL